MSPILGNSWLENHPTSVRVHHMEVMDKIKKLVDISSTRNDNNVGYWTVDGNDLHFHPALDEMRMSFIRQPDQTGYYPFVLEIHEGKIRYPIMDTGIQRQLRNRFYMVALTIKLGELVE